MTVYFHVKYCKLSHKTPKVVENTIKWLKQEYESIFEDRSGYMTVHRYKINSYIGMTPDYNEGGTVKISMIDYIR